MSHAHENPQNLLGRSKDELEQLAEHLGQPRFRGRQLYEAVYKRRLTDLAGMTNLSKTFQEELTRHHRIEYPKVDRAFPSSDSAVRYLLRLADGQFIETVYMPDETRTTLCLSSQVGCAVDCKFCFTALLGVKRSLTAAEIVGQVLAVSAAQSIPHRARLNLVFMGMGEPMLNLPAVMKAVHIIADPNGMGVPLRRITISTAGIVPKIRELGLDPMRPKLAISLNASTDEQREAIMPINRKYPLDALMKACRDYPLRPREHITFEYVMLDGVNDSDADARRVVKLLAGLKAKVNLIPYNGGEEIPYRSSPMRRVMAFQDILVARDIPAYIRISRGQDVRAACGQLSLAGVSG